MKIVHAFNTVISTLFDLVMKPFDTASPWPGLLAASLVLAIIALLVFKYASDQEALHRRKARVVAHLLEIQIFQDDLTGIFSAFGRAFTSIGRYLKVTLKPLVILLVPMMLLLIQLAQRYEYRPLAEGETALLTVRLDEGMDPLKTPVHASASPGIKVETDAFIVPGEPEVCWRLRMGPVQPEAWVDIVVDNYPYRAPLVTGPAWAGFSTKQVRDDAWTLLLEPASRPIPASAPIVSTQIDYPPRLLRIGRMPIHWIVALFLLSLLFGLGLKYPLRVDF